LRSNIDELQSPEASQLVDAGEAVLVSEFSDILTRLGDANSTFSPQSDLFTEAKPKSDDPCPRAVLFDLDGVIYDTLSVQTEVYRTLAKQFCRNELTPEDISGAVRLSPPAAFKRLGFDYSSAKLVYNRQYERSVYELHCVFDSVVSFLRQLRMRGYKVGVVTSQPRKRFEVVARRAGIQDELDVTVTWNETPRGKAKPDPAGLLRALKKVGVEPEHAFYVGDSPSDVEAARRAGMSSIAVTWGVATDSELLRYTPDYLANSFEELHGLLSEVLPE
jgi:pyrophosphatase PpaX